MKKIFALTILLSLAILGSCSKNETSGNLTKTKALASPKMPDSVKKPNEEDYFKNQEKYDKEYDQWMSSRQNQYKFYKEDRDSFNNFSAKIAKNFSNTNQDNNLVYSPINIYLALGLLSETTSGSSKDQILNLLDSKNAEDIKKTSETLWNSNYCDDGQVTSILANSIWLDVNYKYKKDKLDTLAQNYFASIFKGKMGSSSYDNLLQNWLNENTGNFLKDQVQEETFSKDTVLALASTIYYKNSWQSPFSESQTKDMIFKGTNKESKVPFMHEKSSMAYLKKDKFSLVSKPMSDNAHMNFILPNEDISLDSLLNEEEFLNYLSKKDKNEKTDYPLVNFTLPKFDVSSRIDLAGNLIELGISDIFAPDKADFSSIIEDSKGVFLSYISHVARVKIDELGCEAAAYTLSEAKTSAMIENEIEFKLDRPFIFTITSDSGDLLFLGAIKNL